MKVLFDSHALVWFLLGDRRFPVRLRRVLQKPEAQFVISAACIWEITTKVRRGRWPEADDIVAHLSDLLATTDYIPLSITIEHAQMAGLYDWQHRDPFDRILAAQSQIEGIPLMSADPVFRSFGTSVMW
jgi:PIN domain nuclease of toxin-antitoxin system